MFGKDVSAGNSSLNAGGKTFIKDLPRGAILLFCVLGLQVLLTILRHLIYHKTSFLLKKNLEVCDVIL